MFIGPNECVTLIINVSIKIYLKHVYMQNALQRCFAFFFYCRQNQRSDKYPNMPSLGAMHLYIGPALFITGSSGSLSEIRQTGPLHTHFQQVCNPVLILPQNFSGRVQISKVAMKLNVSSVRLFSIEGFHLTECCISCHNVLLLMIPEITFSEK
jgi:hypothetical protein